MGKPIVSCTVHVNIFVTLGRLVATTTSLLLSRYFGWVTWNWNCDLLCYTIDWWVFNLKKIGCAPFTSTELLELTSTNLFYSCSFLQYVKSNDETMKFEVMRRRILFSNLLWWLLMFWSVITVKIIQIKNDLIYQCIIQMETSF